MHHHLKLLCLCIAVALTAGCRDTNGPENPASADYARTPIDPLETCASIGDRVWLDVDCDGEQDKNDAGFSEPGVPDVTVNLYTCEGAFVATTTTDATGFYVFNSVEDTQSYRVCFVLPDGYSFSPLDSGSNDGHDSDAGPDGCAPCISPTPCETIRGIDAGLCIDETTEPCATIGDRVWLDLDCDGFQDKNDSGFTEPGAPNITVSLYRCNGGLVATTTTDENGFYQFSGVDDSFDYRVCFELPDGYSFAPKDAGGNNGEDSDVGPDGCTDCFGLGDCEQVRNVDAGLCRDDEEEYESCSPGFWKNHYTHWVPTGYSPDDIFDDVFGCEVFGDDTTLGEAIHIEWTHNPLAFHGVAALLNSTHPNMDGFPYDEGEVKDLVCDGNKTALSDSVNDVCPLSGGNTNGGGGGKKKH
jgi:hypothetical protein